MASSSSLGPTSNPIPKPIGAFFETVYGTQEGLSSEINRSRVTYTLSGREVSILSDGYGGCHVTVKGTEGTTPKTIRAAVQTLIATFTESKEFNSIWLNFPEPASMGLVSKVVRAPFGSGIEGKADQIKDLKDNMLRFWVWINPDKECTIPPGATHNIGASALIIDTAAQKVLLVENVGRKGDWNIPGGSFDLHKDKTPDATALREAQEEGGLSLEGIDVPMPTLIGQMSFPYNQFAKAINQVWAYFMDGISERKLAPAPDEILRAEWVGIDEILSCPCTPESDAKLREIDLSFGTQQFVRDAMGGRGSTRIFDKGWMVVHSAAKRQRNE